MTKLKLWLEIYKIYLSNGVEPTDAQRKRGITSRAHVAKDAVDWIWKHYGEEEIRASLDPKELADLYNSLGDD